MLAHVEAEKRPLGGAMLRFVGRFSGSIAFPAAMSHFKCFHLAFFTFFTYAHACPLYLQH